MGNCCQSGANQEQPAVTLLKVKSRERRHMSKLPKRIFQNHHHTSIDPQNAEGPQAQPGTSTDISQVQKKDLPEDSDNRPPPSEQGTSAMNMVMVQSRKRRIIFAILHRLRRRRNALSLGTPDSQAPEVLPGASTDTPQTKMEETTVQQGEPPSMVPTERQRCVYTILNHLLRRRDAVTPVPQDDKVPQVLSATITDDPHVKMEVFPGHAKHKSLSVEQKEPSTSKANVQSRKHKCLPAFLRMFFQKQEVSLQHAEDNHDLSKEPPQTLTEELTKKKESFPSPEKPGKPGMIKMESKQQTYVSTIVNKVFHKKTVPLHHVEGAGVLWHAVPEKETVLGKKVLKENKEHELTQEEKERIALDEAKEKLKRNKGLNIILKTLRRDHIIPLPDPAALVAIPTTSAEKSPKLKVRHRTIIKEIFQSPEENSSPEKGIFEEFKSYFPGGLQVKDSSASLHDETSTNLGSYTAQVGDTDLDSVNTNEEYPSAFEIQPWEMRKISSTENPVIQVLHIAPHSSSSEVVVENKKYKSKTKHLQ